MNAPPLGMIGLGLLGSALAERFIAAGFELIGFDLDATCRARFAQLGGRPAPSAQVVAARCRRLVLSLPSSDIVGEVLDALAPLPAEMLVVDTTTGDPEASTALGQRLARSDVGYLDATVVGSSAQARQGDVLVVAGGKRADFDAAADLFAAFARQCFHVGAWGAGARMKLVVNLVLGLHRAVLAEGLAFARAAGVDPATALEVLRAGAAYSRVMDSKGRKMIADEFGCEARLAQHLKDVRLIQAHGRRVGAKLPLSQVHEELLQQLVEAGFGRMDNSAIIKAFGPP